MRRASQLDDSFDMFLDTITNTFGGILLITLLIVLMVRQTSEASQAKLEQDTSGPTKELVHSQLEALTAQRDLLIQSNTASAGFFDGFVSPKRDKNLREIIAQQTLNRRLSQSLEATDQRLIEATEQLANRNAQAEKRREKQSQLVTSQRERAKSLTQEIEDLKGKMVRTIPLPKERTSDKSGRSFFLQDGSLFELNELNGEINFDHFVSCSRLEADYSYKGKAYKVRKGHGISLSSKKLGQVFKKFDSRRSHLTFVIRPEAFGEFANVRQQAVSTGFEYRLIVGNGVISSGAGNVKTQ